MAPAVGLQRCLCALLQSFRSSTLPPATREESLGMLLSCSGSLPQAVWVRAQSTEGIRRRVGVNELMGEAQSSEQVSHSTEVGMMHFRGKEKQKWGKKYFLKKNQSELCQMRVLDS